MLSDNPSRQRSGRLEEISLGHVPLVSVGIPTYNRSDSLRRTLSCIAQQTYKNLEIIVSDNNSQDSTESVVQEFISLDNRIRYYRQPENIGPANNFKFVLEKATGEYFMWAADDDEWSDNFIEVCLNKLNRLGENYVAAITEAQYFTESGKLDFFSEGQPFYDFFSPNVTSRMIRMLKYNYGNLYYSLFRRQSLYDKGQSIFECLDFSSLNEIPLFLFVSQQGNWVVLPAVGLFKKTTTSTYEQAKWEKVGGKLPNSQRPGYYKSLSSNFKYHELARRDIFQVIDHLNLSPIGKAKLKFISFYLLLKHFGCFVAKRKKRAF